MPDVPPKRDIGPIYQIIAGFCLITTVLIGVLHAHHDRPISNYDIYWLAIIALLCLALWRPDNFDSLLKTLADKLPFLSYTKPSK